MFDPAAFTPDLFVASASSSCAFDGSAFDDRAFDVCGTAATSGHPTYRRFVRVLAPPEPLRDDEELLWVI